MAAQDQSYDSDGLLGIPGPAFLPRRSGQSEPAHYFTFSMWFCQVVVTLVKRSCARLALFDMAYSKGWGVYSLTDTPTRLAYRSSSSSFASFLTTILLDCRHGRNSHRQPPRRQPQVVRPRGSLLSEVSSNSLRRFAALHRHRPPRISSISHLTKAMRAPEVMEGFALLRPAQKVGAGPLLSNSRALSSTCCPICSLWRRQRKRRRQCRHCCLHRGELIPSPVNVLSTMRSTRCG